MRSLLDELRLAEADARRELRARAQETLRDRGAALLRHGDDAVSKLEQLVQLRPFRSHRGRSLAHLGGARFAPRMSQALCLSGMMNQRIARPMTLSSPRRPYCQGCPFALEIGRAHV